MREFFGILAGLLTALAYIPQIVKALKTKSAEDLSYGMLFIYMTATICWILHGIMLNSISMIVFNGIVALQIMLIIIIKYIVSKNKKNKARS